MAVSLRGQSDATLDSVIKVLANYEREYPQSEIDIFRVNNVSIRIRIVGPQFQGMNLGDRHDSLWRRFDDLPDEVVGEIYTLLLLTPKEKAKSFASVEFDDPVPLDV